MQLECEASQDTENNIATLSGQHQSLADNGALVLASRQLQPSTANEVSVGRLATLQKPTTAPGGFLLYTEKPLWMWNTGGRYLPHGLFKWPAIREQSLRDDARKPRFAYYIAGCSSNDSPLSKWCNSTNVFRKMFPMYLMFCCRCLLKHFVNWLSFLEIHSSLGGFSSPGIYN